LARSAANSRDRLGSNARQVAEWERAALDALREGRAGEAAAPTPITAGRRSTNRPN